MDKYTSLDEFMDVLDKPYKEQVAFLRATITNTHPELTEHIKWNSPSYAHKGIDRITFSVRAKYPIAIILHMGATQPEDKNGKPIMEDSSGLIEWKSDTRGVISFANIDDIKAKKREFTAIINKWLKIDIN